MSKSPPTVLIGKMWADAHPEATEQLSNHLVVHLFDLFNAQQSIDSLRGSMIDAAIIRVDWLDIVAPFVHALNNQWTHIRHFIITETTTDLLNPQLLDELGVCGSISEKVTVTDFAAETMKVVSSCPCPPERSNYLRRLSDQGRALAEIESHPTDLAIVTLIAEGRTNEDIAGLIHYSQQTVRNHISEILRRTSTKNRTELALAWRRYVLERDLSGPAS